MLHLLYPFLPTNTISHNFFQRQLCSSESLASMGKVILEYTNPYQLIKDFTTLSHVRERHVTHDRRARQSLGSDRDARLLNGHSAHTKRLQHQACSFHLKRFHLCEPSASSRGHIILIAAHRLLSEPCELARPKGRQDRHGTCPCFSMVKLMTELSLPQHCVPEGPCWYWGRCHCVEYGVWHKL